MACRMSCGPPLRTPHERYLATSLHLGPKMGVIWTTSLRRVMALKVYYVPLGHHGATKMCS